MRQEEVNPEEVKNEEVKRPGWKQEQEKNIGTKLLFLLGAKFNRL